MTAKTCKLLCLILIFSCAPATAQTKWIGKEKAERLQKEIMGESVISLDSMGGHLWVEAMGNAGSVIRLHIEYKGFYIRVLPTLSQAKRGLMKQSPSMTDRFEIVPKAFTVNMTVNTKKHCVSEYGQTVKTMSGHLSGVYNNAEPPGDDARPGAVAEWMYGRCQTWLKGQARHHILVESRQADGGGAQCTLFADVMVDGQYSKSSASNRKVDPATVAAAKAAGFDPGSGSQTSRNTQKARVTFGNNENGKPERTRVYLSGLSWMLGGPWPIDKPFSLEDMTLSYSGSTAVSCCKCPVGDQTLSDTSYTLRYQFAMAPQVRIDAELEPVDNREKAWMPSPGEIREYRVKFGDPGQIQAVRFELEDTSSHKGVVTNGGNHMRGDHCEDCAAGPKDQQAEHKTRFGNKGVYVMLTRHYTYHNECPIDTLPDIFFADVDNPGFSMGDDSVGEGLKYTVSQAVETDRLNGDACTVKLRVMDGAASARLKAFVKVGGMWHAVRAVGETATEDGIYLMLPLDADRDGIHDTWEKQWGVDDPDADKDSLMDNPFRGDGLTVFEEYRGVYAQGRHFRLSPVYLDVFIHDYTGHYEAELREVARLFRAQEINLWRLAGGEFKTDIINNTATAHKVDDQFIIVVMDLDQTPELVMDPTTEAFTNMGPPTRPSNTVVMRGTGLLADFASFGTVGVTSTTLAHEIGHMMALPHHGESEGIRELNGKKVWIACIGGQHSGDAACFMKYDCADKFINLDWVPQTNLGRWLSGGELVDFTDPHSERTHFCTTPHGAGQCGDATEGCCLGKIRIKSY